MRKWHLILDWLSSSWAWMEREEQAFTNQASLPEFTCSSSLIPKSSRKGTAVKYSSPLNICVNYNLGDYFQQKRESRASLIPGKVLSKRIGEKSRNWKWQTKMIKLSFLHYFALRLVLWRTPSWSWRSASIRALPGAPGDRSLCLWVLHSLLPLLKIIPFLQPCGTHSLSFWLLARSLCSQSHSWLSSSVRRRRLGRGRGSAVGRKDMEVSHRDAPVCDSPGLPKVNGVKRPAVSCGEPLLSPVGTEVGNAWLWC